MAAAAGVGGAAGTGTAEPIGDEQRAKATPHDSDSGEPLSDLEAVVAFRRNVEELRGHLASSAALLAAGRQEDAALHAGHAADYYGPVLTPLRDVDASLATRLRALLGELPDRVRSEEADAYERHIQDTVVPHIEDATEAVVADDLAGATDLTVRVANALAGRIAEEYVAAVTPGREIELAGEYWDARGFLTRVEALYDGPAAAVEEAVTDPLATLRSRVDDVAAPSAVAETALALRVAATAAADLPAAGVADRATAVDYVRNAEEVRGHLDASVRLLTAGDASAAVLHGGHGADYAATLLPPVRRADPDLAADLREALLGIDAAGDAAAYERRVTEEILPLVGDAVDVAVPEEFVGETAFSAAVTIALLERIAEEYTAAVAPDETIERYGEYWDARGFYGRVAERVSGLADDLDGEVREAVTEEIELLGRELRTATTPGDVAGSVEALVEALEPVAEPAD